MNTIDQRILIPSSPDFVWGYLSDISKNPEWQADCLNISFLTTTHTGQGIRWRCTTKKRREYVVEVSAWYDGLGYEYKIIDGSPYSQNQGLIRLQEVAEGTVVQWTFRYQPSGFFSGIRNTLSTKRNVDNTIVNSLWALWRNITELKAEYRAAEPYTPKALMRDAPDVEARLHYQPRHTPIANKPIIETDIDLPVIIDEPPIKEDDTKPRVAATLSAPPPPTQPILNTSIVEDVKVQSGEKDEAIPAATLPPIPPIEEPVEQSQRDLQLPRLSDPELDTSRISVFDLFGVEKPGTTVPEPKSPAAQEAMDTKEKELPSITSMVNSPDLSSEETIIFSGRTGLRIATRSKLVKVRRPK